MYFNTNASADAISQLAKALADAAIGFAVRLGTTARIACHLCRNARRRRLYVRDGAGTHATKRVLEEMQPATSGDTCQCGCGGN